MAEADVRKLLIEVPEETLAILKQDEAGLAREIKIAAAVKWYEMGQLSQGRAAQLAGVGRSEFLLILGRFGVSPFQEEPEELRGESEVA